MTVADTNALARAGAAVTGQAYRVFVGPLLQSVGDALLIAGEPYTLPLTTTIMQAVHFGLDAIDMIVANAEGFPNVSGEFALESASGATWVRYTLRDGNALVGCKRVYGAYTQPAGAKVSRWAEISAQVNTADESGSAGDTVSSWKFELSGEHFNSDLQRNDCSVLVFVSVAPDVEATRWSDYKIAGYGYVRNWGAEGDNGQVRRWRTTLESIRTYVDTYQAKGGTFGRVNLALNRPVSASDALPNPRDPAVRDEWVTAGFIGTTDADKITNGDINDGPYVSQIAPSQDPEVPAADGSSDDPGVIFNQIYIEEGFWWFKVEFVPYGTAWWDEDEDGNQIPGSQDLNDFAFCNKQTDYRARNGEPDTLQDGYGFFYVRGTGVVLTHDQPYAIFTNNRTRFLARYSQGNSILVDVREQPAFGTGGALPAADFDLDPNADFLTLRYCVGTETVRDLIPWGAVTSSDWWHGDAEDEDESGGEWLGESAEAIPNGKSLRRFPPRKDTNKNIDWIIEDRPNPIDQYTDTDVVFMAVSFDDIPTALSEDITNVLPGAGGTLLLSEPDYLRPDPTIFGTNRQLVIRIELEQMLIEHFGSAWRVVARGYNGTTPAAHVADTPIEYYYEGEGFIRLPYASEVELRRWARYYPGVVGAGGPIPNAPHTWEIWGSREEDPVFAGEDAEFELDWINDRGEHNQIKTVVVESVPQKAAAEQNIFTQKAAIPPMPLRWTMVVGKRMQLDSTAWMCNELLVWRDGLTETDPTQPGIGGVVMRYLSEFPGRDFVTVDPDTFAGTSGNVTITGGALGNILYGLAETYGFYVEYTRDNRIHLKRHHCHPLATRPEPFATITPGMLEAKLAPQWSEYPSRVGAGQFEVRIHDADALTVYKGRYPRVNRFGDVRVIPLEMAGVTIDTPDLIAQMHYLMDDSISRTVDFTIVGLFPELREGMRLIVFDYTDYAAPTGRYVDCFVKEVRRRSSAPGVFVRCQVWRQI